MISHYFIQILILSQVIYLINLLVTNVSSMFFIFYTLPSVIVNYFTEQTNLIRNFVRSQTHLPVSILMPAYNEETTILDTTRMLFDIEFNEYEIIVINDGSEDSTLEKLKEAFDLYPIPTPPYLPLKHKPIRQVYHSHRYENLTVIDKENGGKADALNAGVNLSRYPLLCSLDADTLLNRDAILKAVLLFTRDKRVIAAGGSIGIFNGSSFDKQGQIRLSLPHLLLERMQIIEYTRAFLAGRTFWSAINGILIISGAFGIFRKDIVMGIQGYRDTTGEDLDLLIRMRRHCYEQKLPHRVSFLPDIMCWTQAPSDYPSLLKQRNRWHRGLIESLYYNRKMLFNPRYGVVGLLTLPYYLLIEALNPLITFMGSISIIVLYFADLVNQDTIILFFILEFIWGMALNVFSFWLEVFVRHSYPALWIFRLLANSILEPFYYKPLVKMEQLIATFTFMSHKWGKARRHEMDEISPIESQEAVMAQREWTIKRFMSFLMRSGLFLVFIGYFIIAIIVNTDIK